MNSKSLVLYFTALIVVSCSPRLMNQTINKKREGLWVEKYSLDSLHYKSIGNYKNNEPTKKWRYYLDGKIIKKEKYKARFCKTKLYHQNGQLQSKGKTVLDTSGKYAHWYYQDEWKFYDNEGKLLSRSTYHEGELAAENNTIKIKKYTMQQLTKSEEQVMEHLWKLEKAFMKDLLDAFPEPRPKTTTVATLLKRMIDKDFVAYTEFGNSREYYPIVKKTAYFSKHVNGLIKDFFNDSASQFASFFTNETNLTAKELEELKKIIDTAILKKKK